MPDTAVQLPHLPHLPALALRGLPLVPLTLMLQGFARRMARRHPALFKRLGDYNSARYVLDPTDLPLTLLLEPRGGHPRLQLSRRPQLGDARIAGPLAALLGMVHGAYDGDALFFSRDLLIEGDTAAVLALRNAIDDAELDLAGEAAALSGPLATQIRRLIDLAEQKTGVALSRQQEEDPW